ncbi:hypothetical protein JSE7799_01835 [Jannaschia seosinensis]|uniref:Uncharacterized protein n=1 Tax=Jannaschia seosinensis TaxID=313367 RepID=A0A0M7BBD0_9RHOB|nr:hypothetical protein [Jannaschia seosinensis]CUH39114.1 hypothetical protein JSE7799_01835 [Jannaschia seosinensis]
MGHTGRIATLIAAGFLAGCGGGEARDAARQETVAQAPLIDQIVSLTAAPTPGGVIVTATGLPPTQGYWDATLVPVEAGPGTLIMDFQIAPPVTPKPSGTQPSREVLAGGFVSMQDLGGATTIVVRAARNQQSVTRQ